MTSCQPVLAGVDLFALGTLALAFLILMPPQIKNGSVCVVVLRITEKTEQGVSIKFCKNVRRTYTETDDMLKLTFGEDSTSRTQVFLNRFIA